MTCLCEGYNQCTPIYISESGFLNLGDIDGTGKLANPEQYQMADRCEGSVFEALEHGELVKLADKCYFLDENLDIIIEVEILP